MSSQVGGIPGVDSGGSGSLIEAWSPGKGVMREGALLVEVYMYYLFIYLFTYLPPSLPPSPFYSSSEQATC